MQYDILEAFLLFLLIKKFGDFRNREEIEKECSRLGVSLLISFC